ncbi:MAG: rhodanese-like domain-containing protein [Nocardioidaceae bacterium]
MQIPAVIVVETPTLGDRSYVVHAGSVAAVIDPQRDIDRILSVAQREGVRITHVFETHVHNDYLTGGLALSEETGADYHVNALDDVGFTRTGIGDGDVVEVGAAMRLRAIATPGHTFTHLAYALDDGAKVVGVFTGGSLLYGATGRPDLLGREHTHDLVRLQYSSAHRLAAELPDDACVHPTHGFGSFCSASQTDATESTIGDERRLNPALTDTEDAYVETLLAGLDDFPAYYAHMSEANAVGPGRPDLSAPTAADRDDLRRRLDAGEWVVDLRTREAFAAGHLRGTLNFGLDGQLSTYLGWLMQWGAPLTLLGETPGQVAEGQRELARIGIERPQAAATGGPTEWSIGPLGSFPRATFADLAREHRRSDLVVLDVRRRQEYAKARIGGAVHVPIHQLPARVGDVPAGQVWVHCAGGYRASVAASLLAAGGRDVVAVDDDFANARPAGLPVTAV